MFDLKNYRSEKEKILSNDKLSQKGKDAAIAKLEKSSKDSAREAIKPLRKAAVINALKLHDTQAKRAEKVNGELAKVDYARLNYEAQAVRSKITAADSLSDVMAIWENAKRSNDAYALKAWKDTSQGLVTEKFDGPDYVDLQGTLFNDIQETQAEIVKIETTKEELEAFEKLHEIRNQAEEVNDAFGHGQAVVNRVFDGIGFENGNVKLGFEREINKLSEKPEYPYEVFNRLESERDKTIENHKAATKGFDAGLDYDFDDMRGVL